MISAGVSNFDTSSYRDLNSGSSLSQINSLATQDQPGRNSGQGKFGPNSTADSSVINSLTKQPSSLSNAQRLNGDQTLQDQASMKVKMLIGNLRNPQQTSASKPRYLNTIESEGNLPTKFGDKKDACLSQRSIHSLESLQSEGSKAEAELDHANIRVNLEERAANYNDFMHSLIDKVHTSTYNQSQGGPEPRHASLE